MKEASDIMTTLLLKLDGLSNSHSQTFGKKPHFIPFFFKKSKSYSEKSTTQIFMYCFFPSFITNCVDKNANNLSYILFTAFLPETRSSIIFINLGTSCKGEI